jgi:hypothetical protein
VKYHINSNMRWELFFLIYCLRNGREWFVHPTVMHKLKHNVYSSFSQNWMFDLPAPCTPVPSLNVTDQVSHLYNTRVKTVVLCLCIFNFVDSKREDKRFWTKPYQIFSDLLGECNFQLSLSHIQILHSLYHDSVLHLEGDTQICTEGPRCLVLL